MHAPLTPLCQPNPPSRPIKCVHVQDPPPLRYATCHLPMPSYATCIRFIKVVLDNDLLYY